MPTLSRWFLKGGLVCLGVGALAGALILVHKGTGRFPTLWVLLPAHTYLMVVGGISQCALGVCYWILPRFEGRKSRRATWLAWGSYAMLNGSIVLIACHPLLQVLLGVSAATVAFKGAGVLQGMAALAFVLHIWPRIRPPRLLPRRGPS
jgi:hypothetical protein